MASSFAVGTETPLPSSEPEPPDLRFSTSLLLDPPDPPVPPDPPPITLSMERVPPLCISWVTISFVQSLPIPYLSLEITKYMSDSLYQVHSFSPSNSDVGWVYKERVRLVLLESRVTVISLIVLGAFGSSIVSCIGLFIISRQFTVVYRFRAVCTLIETDFVLYMVWLDPSSLVLTPFVPFAALVRFVTVVCRMVSFTAICGIVSFIVVCWPRPLTVLYRYKCPIRHMLKATKNFINAARNVGSIYYGFEWICTNQSIITLHQGSTSHLFALLALVVEGLALKAAIIAASKSEIQELCLFPKSQSLVTFFNIGDVIIELKSFPFDMCCLLGSFSFAILYLYVAHLAIVPLESLMIFV